MYLLVLFSFYHLVFKKGKKKDCKEADSMTQDTGCGIWASEDNRNIAVSD